MRFSQVASEFDSVGVTNTWVDSKWFPMLACDSFNVQHDTTYENMFACVVRVLHCEKRVAIHQ